MTPELWDKIASAGQIAIALAVGVVSFFQWRLSATTERREHDARLEDLADVREAAYRALWAEWYRIWAISHRWSKADLLAEAGAGILNPTDILPRDWPSATSHLATLGAVPSYLGGYAFTLAHDAAELARRLTAGASALPDFTRTQPHHLHGFVDALSPQLRDTETSLKHLVVEVAALLQDALEHSPGATTPRSYQFNDALHSETARRLRAEVTGKRLSPEIAKEAIRAVTDDKGE